MSTINKKPVIETILGRMSLSELETLSGLMNGEDLTPTFITLINRAGDHVLSTDDKGVSFVNLCVSNLRAQNTYEGYLIYNDTDCALISFTGSKNQNLCLIIIDPAKLTYEFINEPVSVVGLRSEVKSYLTAKGGNVQIQANDVDSTGAGAGKALISTAEGGAEWGSVGGITLDDIVVTYNDADDETYYAFPEGIEPCSFGDELHYYFLDYVGMRVYDSTGNVVGEINFSVDGKIVVTLYGNHTDYPLGDITYVNLLHLVDFGGVLPNWHGAFKQLGTKLYKHVIKSGYYTIIIYSTTSKSITDFSLSSDTLDNISYVSAQYRNGSDSYPCIPVSVSAGYYPPLSFTAKLLSLENLSSLTFINLSSIDSDRVTEL